MKRPRTSWIARVVEDQGVSAHVFLRFFVGGDSKISLFSNWYGTVIFLLHMVELFGVFVVLFYHLWVCLT